MAAGRSHGNWFLCSFFFFAFCVYSALSFSCRYECVPGPSCVHTCRMQFDGCSLNARYLMQLYQCTTCDLSCVHCCERHRIGKKDRRVDAVAQIVEKRYDDDVDNNRKDSLPMIYGFEHY